MQQSTVGDAQGYGNLHALPRDTLNIILEAAGYGVREVSRALRDAFDAVNPKLVVRLCGGNSCFEDRCIALASRSPSVTDLRVEGPSLNFRPRWQTVLLMLPFLRRLSFNGLSFKTTSADRIAPAMHGLTHVEELSLSRTDMWHPNSASFLCLAVSHLWRLRKLDISWNPMKNGRGDESKMLVLSAMLGSLTRLEHLNMSMNKIGSVGALTLSGALEKLQSLRNLDVSHNDLCNVGATAVLEALKGNSQLKCLDRATTPFTL